MKNYKALSVFAVPLFLFSHDAYANPVNVEGKAPIGKKIDYDSALFNAIADGKSILIDTLIRESLGADAANVSGEIRSKLSSIITSSNFKILKQQQANQNLYVTISFDVDSAWFRTKLEEFGLYSKSFLSSSDTIAILIDSNYGVSRNLAKPKEVVSESWRSKGGSFVDRSSVDYSERQRSASSSNSRYSAGGYASGSAAAASSYGASAAAVSGAVSSSASNRMSSSYNGAQSFASKNDISAEVHDDEWRFERIVNQDGSGMASPSLDATIALQARLQKSGVQSQSILNFSDFFKNQEERLKELQAGQKMTEFRNYLSGKGVNFLLTGSMSITDGGISGFGTDLSCSGTFNAEVTSTIENVSLGAGFSQMTATGSDAQSCQNALVALLSDEVGDQVSDLVNKFYVRQDSKSKSVATYLRPDTNRAIEYDVVFLSNNLFDFNNQRKVSSILSNIGGGSQSVKIYSDRNKMIFKVNYFGQEGIENSIGSQLVVADGLKGFSVKSEGRAVTFCFDSCR